MVMWLILTRFFIRLFSLPASLFSVLCFLYSVLGLSKSNWFSILLLLETYPGRWPSIFITLLLGHKGGRPWYPLSGVWDTSCGHHIHFLRVISDLAQKTSCNHHIHFAMAISEFAQTPGFKMVFGLKLASYGSVWAHIRNRRLFKARLVMGLRGPRGLLKVNFSSFDFSPPGK